MFSIPLYGCMCFGDRVVTVRTYWNTFRCQCRVHDCSFTNCRHCMSVMVNLFIHCCCCNF